MPVLSGRFEWNAGPIREVGILPEGVSAKSVDPHMCPALFDTGALSSCILKPVVDYLGLEPRGQRTLHTAGPAVEVSLYQVQFFFLLDQDSKEDLIASENWDLAGPVLAPGLNPEGAGRSRYQAIIGRDILRKGVFTLLPGGQYAFGY